MRRREFIASLAALGLTSGAARAQPAILNPVVGFLALPARVPPAEPYFAAFEKALTGLDSRRAAPFPLSIASPTTAQINSENLLRNW